MQLLGKLKSRAKNRTVMILLILFAALVLIYFFSERAGLPSIIPLPGVGTTAAGLAAPRDQAVYQAAEQFILALIKDEREVVLSMLTEEHRLNWTDASFLYDRTALQLGQSAELGSFRHSVVNYIQSPELGGQTLALVTVKYTVLFKNETETTAEIQIEESMALQLVNESWLIAADQREIISE
ncbi:MAG: hypothetical protein KGZ56_10350 [Dethiobacter sp.]|nr:hypothetical protein [Dethiobacter sp.]MBS3899847.1 hypothetical protein [Dethiobacter sp.]